VSDYLGLTSVQPPKSAPVIGRGVATSGRGLCRAIRELGKSLGSTPDMVALNLKEMGVRGSPRQPTGCPIARYLQAVVGTEAWIGDVVVWDRSVHIYPAGRRIPRMIWLPRAVVQFMDRFDNGAYPELVDLMGHRHQAPRAGRT
jgi:hypothetical protein